MLTLSSSYCHVFGLNKLYTNGIPVAMVCSWYLRKEVRQLSEDGSCLSTDVLNCTRNFKLFIYDIYYTYFETFFVQYKRYKDFHSLSQ